MDNIEEDKLKAYDMNVFKITDCPYMEEIKLRAWNKETALMGQCCTLNEILYFAHRNPSRESDLPLLIWMQYTGLKDKNGVEIFTGDIVMDGGGKTTIVTFGKQEWLEDFGDILWYIGFNTPMGGYGWGQSGKADWDELEVIGNVWENPELTFS